MRKKWINTLFLKCVKKNLNYTHTSYKVKKRILHTQVIHKSCGKHFTFEILAYLVYYGFMAICLFNTDINIRNEEV